MLKELFSDWRVLSAVAILGWGLWGIMSKLSLRQLDWRVVLFVASIAAFPIVIALGLGPLLGWGPNHSPVKINKYVLFACIAGFGSTIATLAFNRALQKGGPANVVVPLTSQYVLVIVLFSTFFLREPLTWNRIVGIVAAVAAIVLLSL